MHKFSQFFLLVYKFNENVLNGTTRIQIIYQYTTGSSKTIQKFQKETKNARMNMKQQNALLHRAVFSREQVQHKILCHLNV